MAALCRIYVQESTKMRNFGKNELMDTIKSLKYLCAAALLVFLATSCRVSTSSSSSGKIPPGQAKKMSGSKSAKAYAPGQRKKQ